jgi:hypothetical protein
MATQKQVRAAKHNVKKAQAGARTHRTIANLPRSVRQDLSRNAAAGRAGAAASRGGASTTVPGSSSTKRPRSARSPAVRAWGRRS